MNDSEWCENVLKINIQNSLPFTLLILPFENVSAARNNGLIRGAMEECIILSCCQNSWSVPYCLQTQYIGKENYSGNENKENEDHLGELIFSFFDKVKSS